MPGPVWKIGGRFETGICRATYGADMENLGRTLILVGVVLLALGSLLYFLPAIPFLGRLPGDIRIERPGLHIYVPITTCLLLSAILSLLFWMFSRLR